MPAVPSTPRHRYLTRDERLQVRTLHLTGHPRRFIQDSLNLSKRQVAYALASERVTPKKRSGRPPSLTYTQTDQLETFIQSLAAARQMSFLRLAEGPFEDWEVGKKAIRAALKGRGYTRRVA